LGFRDDAGRRNAPLDVWLFSEELVKNEKANVHFKRLTGQFIARPPNLGLAQISSSRLPRTLEQAFRTWFWRGEGAGDSGVYQRRERLPSQFKPQAVR
jgi:hypothetical protein